MRATDVAERALTTSAAIKYQTICFPWYGALFGRPADDDLLQSLVFLTSSATAIICSCGAVKAAAPPWSPGPPRRSRCSHAPSPRASDAMVKVQRVRNARRASPGKDRSVCRRPAAVEDRKSTRLNSSHLV